MKAHFMNSLHVLIPLQELYSCFGNILSKNDNIQRNDANKLQLEGQLYYIIQIYYTISSVTTDVYI